MRQPFTCTNQTTSTQHVHNERPDKNDNTSPTESSQASRSRGTEVLATGEASTAVDVQNKVTDSISSMSLSTNDSKAGSPEN